MKNILVIFKKEIKRFFTDRRMLLAMFLPGILIFGMYKLMGTFFRDAGSKLQEEATNVTYNIAYTDNYSSDTSIKPRLISFFDDYLNATKETKHNDAKYIPIATSELDAYKEKVKNGDVDVVIQYSDNFDEKVNSEKGNIINVYYNGEVEKSENLYSTMMGFVEGTYTNYTVNVEIKDVDGVPTASPLETNVGESSALAGKIISLILPMVTVSLLYSTVISFCPESISGEKERGTLASILMTPIKRSEFAIGKILALSVVAALSGIVSFLGLLFSLPDLMGGMALPFTAGQIVLLLFIIISTLLLFVAFGVLISSIANSVKEAASYLGPLTMVFMILALVPSITGLNSTALGFVPVMNLAVSISALLSQAENATLLLVFTVITNTVLTGAFVFGVTRLFKKETIVLGH